MLNKFYDIYVERLIFVKIIMAKRIAEKKSKTFAESQLSFNIILNYLKYVIVLTKHITEVIFLRPVNNVFKNYHQHYVIDMKVIFSSHV